MITWSWHDHVIVTWSRDLEPAEERTSDVGATTIVQTRPETDNTIFRWACIDRAGKSDAGKICRSLKTAKSALVVFAANFGLNSPSECAASHSRCQKSGFCVLSDKEKKTVTFCLWRIFTRHNDVKRTLSWRQTAGRNFNGKCACFHVYQTVLKILHLTMSSLTHKRNRLASYGLNYLKSNFSGLGGTLTKLIARAVNISPTPECWNSARREVSPERYQKL